MNLNTENYTYPKNLSAMRNINERGNLSSVKKRRNLPQIAPLNFDEIKKEIEEYEHEQNRSLLLLNEKNEDTLKALGLSTKTNVSPESTLKEISNKYYEKTDQVKSNVGKTSNVIIADPLGASHSFKENALQGKKDDDSFDLNFSALTISTPIKKSQSVSTPGNKLSVCKEGIVTDFNNFITPKVSNRPAITYSISRRPLLKSSSKDSNESFAHEVVSRPQNNTSQEIVCTIPKNVPKDETFTKIIVKNTEYIILNLLGKGGSSEVFQCFSIEKKHLVAIKCVSLANKIQAVGYINEVKLLHQLQNCERIVTMYDYEILEEEKKLFMVLEKGGLDLSKILDNLSKQENHIPLYRLLFYWMEMLYAVKQIHESGVIHSDLKPANFLEVSHGLKLIDFGIASAVQPDMTSVLKVSAEGSCNYISPEALKETSSSPMKAKYKVHFKSDVWSLGCILYQLIYRRTPFQHLKNLYMKLSYILNPDHEIEYPQLDWLPAEFVNAIKMCLRYKVSERPSVYELVEKFETMSSNWKYS